MASLDTLINHLDVQAAPFAICNIRDRWAPADQNRDQVSLYFALKGEGVVELPARVRMRFEEGYVVICPPGARISIEPVNSRGAEGPATICRQLLGLVDLEDEPSAGGIAIACGTMSATFKAGIGLFDYLKEAIVEDLSDSILLKDAFRELVEEMRTGRPGATAIVSCILRRCLVAILRRRWQADVDPPGWLLALDEPQLRRAVSAMLDRPTQRHSLESLAALSGMSRSVFARRFADTFKQTPITFLRKVRLQRAATELQSGSTSVKAVAVAAGFRSRSYFWRAFKETYGVDPETFRRRAVSARNVKS